MKRPVHPGKNVGIGKDHTIFTLIDGLLKFEKFGPHRKKVIQFCHQSIGLRTLLHGSRTITDGMLQAAVECLAKCMTEDEVVKGIILPQMSRLGSKLSEMEVKQLMEAHEYNHHRGLGTNGATLAIADAGIPMHWVWFKMVSES
ncbi:50S ribosomal protein L27, chloroplastic [Tanacetum coccineum]